VSNVRVEKGCTPQPAISRQSNSVCRIRARFLGRRRVGRPYAASSVFGTLSEISRSRVRDTTIIEAAGIPAALAAVNSEERLPRAMPDIEAALREFVRLRARPLWIPSYSERFTLKRSILHRERSEPQGRVSDSCSRGRELRLPCARPVWNGGFH